MADLSVCVFSRALPQWSHGGVETLVFETSKRLVRRGCEVHIICDGNYLKTNKDYRIVEGIHVHFVKPKPLFNIPNISYSLKAAEKALVLDQIFDFDIFHGHGIYGFGFALFKFLKKTDKPFVTTIHNVILRDAQTTIRSIFFDLSNLVLHFINTVGLTLYSICEGALISRIANKIIAVSNFTKMDAIKTYGIPAEKITVIQNGVDIDKFSPKISGDVIRRRLSLLNEPLVLYLGRFDYRKGVENLVKAIPLVLQQNEDVKFLLVGKGPFENALKNLAVKLRVKDSIIFHPSVSDFDLPKYYAAADVFVFPSLWEGFGLSLLEALASGKAIISTNVSAIPEIITHNKTGLLVEPKNHKQIAEAIVKVLKHRNYLINLGIEGRKEMESKFNWDITSNEILKLYESLINNP